MPHLSIRPGPEHTCPKRGADSGSLCNCRADPWCLILASTSTVAIWGAAEPLLGVRSLPLFGIPTRVTDQTLLPADPYMHLAVYDLVGALFAPSDPVRVSLHADKLCKRICDIIREHFANPAFGPCEVAAEAGISLRYVQKLFTAQNSTCSHFIYSVRLNHAARLLGRRELLGASQPLSEIAYACGFADYANFSRKFRRRFGYSPSVHSEVGSQDTDDATFGANPKSRLGF